MAKHPQRDVEIRIAPAAVAVGLPSHRPIHTRLGLLVQQAQRNLRLAYLDSTRALVAAAEAKEPHTRAHATTVARYSRILGKSLNLDPADLECVHTAALLHDIGKISIPDAILTKPGPLTDEERRVVERHPEAALDIIGHVGFLTAERPLILHHHERYDGTGYPARLRGEDIPWGARIIAMADALDAMLSPRSYKPAYDLPRVRAEVERESGGQFDPQVARAALSLLDDLSREPKPHHD